MTDLLYAIGGGTIGTLVTLTAVGLVERRWGHAAALTFCLWILMACTAFGLAYVATM